MAHHYKEGDSRRYRDTSRYLPAGVGLSIINYRRMAEVDAIYNDCQRFRDFYKDQTGRLHRVEGFEAKTNVYSRTRNPTEVYLSLPRDFYTATQPIVYRK